LTRLFDHTLCEDTDSMIAERAVALNDLRWAIANTIACTRPFGVSKWLRRTLQDPRLGQSKQMLFIAAARMLDASEAAALIAPFFEEFPAQCASALGECGGEKELSFLRDKLTLVTGETKKELKRAIRRIQKRISDGDLDVGNGHLA
jgi:hypothetical protein